MGATACGCPATFAQTRVSIPCCSASLAREPRAAQGDAALRCQRRLAPSAARTAGTPGRCPGRGRVGGPRRVPRTPWAEKPLSLHAANFQALRDPGRRTPRALRNARRPRGAGPGRARASRSEVFPMPASAFAPPTDFLGTLWSYKLVNTRQLGLCNDFVKQHPVATPCDLLNFAVERKILSRFQSNLILEGNVQALLLPPYVPVDATGSGELGQVYRARGQNDERRYLIKVLARRNRPGTPKVSQVMQGFTAFRHPAVVPITHVGTVSERTFVVWPDLEEGEALDEIVRGRGRLAPKLVVHYGLQAARALHACHEQGLFHGLLKASDFQIDIRHHVRIRDLGIGFLLTLSREDSAVDTMTSLGQLASGLDWASPESLMDARDRTPRSDQYSLGCVLYFCLTGKVPFPVTSKVKKMMAHQMEEPVPVRQLNPEAPARLEAIVQRLMR